MGLHGDNFCGGSCVDVQRNYCLIPAVGNLRGRSFFVPARTHSGKAVKSTNSYFENYLIFYVFLFSFTISSSKYSENLVIIPAQIGYNDEVATGHLMITILQLFGTH